MSNDRIHGIAKEKGFCCPFGMLKKMEGPKDSHNRVAQKTGLSYSAVKFNRRRIKEGSLVCAKKENCCCAGED